MDPIDYLIRESLKVRGVNSTFALLGRSIFPRPSCHHIQRIATEMGADGDQRAAYSERMSISPVAAQSGSEALLRRQLETQQVASFPAMAEHWRKHGAPKCADLLTRKLAA